MTASIDRRWFLGGAMLLGSNLLLAPPVRAQGAVSAAAAAGAERQTPLEAWQEWLSERGLNEGVTVTENPADFRILSFAEAAVPDGPANRFMERRGITFNRAVLQAKSDLARQVSVAIESDQMLEFLERNPDVAPPMLEEATRPVSTADRARQLANLTLDDQIRRFDPTWNGAGRTDEERRSRLARSQESYRNNIRTNSRLFTSGAMSVCVFDGMNAQGQLVLGVGMLWSIRSQKIAQSIIDANIVISPAPYRSVRDQINDTIAQNPNFLATAYGLQITRDEKGDAVILAYVSVDQSSSGFRNEGLTRDLATQMLQAFVAEQVVADTDLKGLLSVQTQQDNSNRTFNSSSYENRVSTTAPRMTISGISVVRQWQGMHPSIRTPVYARVFAWSPSSRAAATRVQEMSDTQRQALDRAVGSPNAATPNTVRPSVGETERGTSGGTQAVPTRRGQSTNLSDF